MRRITVAATCALALLATTTILCAQPAAPPQFAAKLSAAELRIETALAKPVKLSFRETPLKDLIADLAKQIDLPIELDPKGLEEADTTADQAVTLELGTLGLRSGLNAVLSPLHLSYIPSATGLSITSEEIASERLVTRIYPVGDVIPAAQREGFPSVPDYDTLIDTITSHLAADSWPDGTGPGPIRWGPGECLVVRQTLTVQREVEQLLQAIRRLKSDQSQLKSVEVGPVIDLCNSKPIRDAFAKRDSTTLDIELKFYLQDVAKVIKTPIVMDAEGLEEADVSPDQMIHIAYRDARIGDVFRQTLKKLHLSYYIREGHVLVTSIGMAGEAPTTRIYPVGDLSPLRAVQDPPVRDFDTLIEFITFSVDSSVWTGHGGSSSISGWPEPAALIVTTTNEVHDNLEEVLATLRASGLAEFNAEQAEADQRIVERIYPLYMARREKQAKAVKGDKPPEEIPTADDVAKLIAELLPEVSFKEMGTLLRPFHDRLIVRHRPAMLHKIEKLLEKIDAWPPHQGQGGMGGVGGGGFFSIEREINE